MYDFDFADYILFVGGVSNTVRIDDEINSFGIENVNFDALLKMVEGLKEETKEKEYIDDKDITDTNISDFFKKVRFVVDDRKPSEYVKDIIKDHPELVPEEKVLDMQLRLKELHMYLMYLPSKCGTILLTRYMKKSSPTMKK